MATSAENEVCKSRTLDEEWKVVLPCHGKKHRRATPKVRKHEEYQWAPSDTEIDAARESKLIERIETCLKRVESSRFYKMFLDQFQSPEVVDSVQRVLGSELKMQMVVYGIGSVESYDPPRLQLSLALLMKRKFDWIGDVEIFDPVLSVTETRVLKVFGCSVLSVNEQGRRCAVKPTVFYMPHCEAELYDNLLQANWGSAFLNKIVLFGNSFETYEQHVSEFKNSTVSDSSKHILAVRRFTNEHKIDVVSDDFYGAFHDSSWHFFNLHSEMQLQQI